MKLRKTLFALTVTLALIAAPAALRAQSGPKGKIEGVWNAVLTADEGGFQEAERYTFTDGATVDDGAVIFSNEVDAVPPCGTDHGAWARGGARQFRLNHGAFCVDLSNGAPAYRIRFREQITLNAKDDQFAGRGVFEVFDPQGGMLFSATYSVRGTRAAADGAANGLSVEDADAAPQTDSLTRGQGPLWKRWIKNLQQ